MKMQVSDLYRELWLLRVKLPASIDDSDDFLSQGGFSLRTFTQGRDESVWLELNSKAFVSHPEQGTWDRLRLEEKMSEPWFNPERFYLCFDSNNSIAGCVWNKTHMVDKQSIGEIFILCVAPDHQRCGLGRALVKKSLSKMIEDNISKAMVYTDATNLRAISLYQSFGFTLSEIEHIYSQVVTEKH